MNTELSNRYDFLLIFDVQDGNPNGDPDAGNMPRVDAETGEGLVTDVCLKRKVRNYVQLTRENKPGYGIFIREKSILNDTILKAYNELDINLDSDKDADNKKRKELGHGQGSEIDKVRNKLCAEFFDIRAFGAVMSTGANAGQVRGPVQLTFARSVDPIVPTEHSITRMAVAKIEDSSKAGGEMQTMGRKYTVPYGLYVAHGFVSPALAHQTGFSTNDLEILWEALSNMFEQDRSATRGMMSCRKLIVFKHDSKFGNEHANKLFERVKINKKGDCLVPRKYDDYEINIDRKNLKGVEILEML